MKLNLVVLSVLIIAVAHFCAEASAAPEPKKGGKIPVGSIAGALGGAAATVGASAAGGNIQARSIEFDSSERVARSPKRKLSGSGILSGASLGADLASAALGAPGR